MKRYLIINTDDFGYAEGVNLGILEGFNKGIITSTSLMVNGSAIKHACKLAEKNPHLGLGLHFQVANAIRDILNKPEKAQANNIYSDIEQEFIRQYEQFKALTGKKPDHIDSHHNIHRHPYLLPFFQSFCKQEDIPMRCDVNFIDSFFGLPSTESLTVEYLLRLIKTLPIGVSELMCHPGRSSTDLKSSYSSQRETELNILISRELIEEIRDSQIMLLSWGDYTQLMKGSK